MNIILLGYMGCGKSAVGKSLAAKLLMDYIDLDAYLVTREKDSIPNLFKTKGELYFRKKETLYLQEILNNNSNTVVSLGGGTPCFGENIKLINDSINSRSIYLKTSINELVNRLLMGQAARPLIAHLKTKEELKEFIAKHLFERSYYYHQASYTITTDCKSILQIGNEIKNRLF